ncbi:DUF1501 domain-containing protein [Octadecabacter sp. 1_MG-2023]|uniref:DUF1501 domain-containing protein n=1 Tax=unclassified Octadecabacter TaxID=196158 RepID=UPI001C0978CB|nr:MULTISPECIES: DUF1501 domain-containing protein [unclassified Octadecabacter]MBU2994656.1 DUF1501 domain-containing protein [Octadecabacter sp. B2R22]MDO6734051.1 DUF1501 domain-containing protein [Octadecabacter sp. 1_MG-2023]
MDRRNFLIGGTALGCSAAASPFVTPVAMAAAPWDTRLVVVILRGAMDGLDVIQPYGDPALAGLRPSLLTGEAGDAIDLDGFYALNPLFSSLMPLWRAGQFGAAHAVSTPYRDKRSHFDGQDILEAGIPDLDNGGLRDGWLNRMLQVVPGLEAEVAFAIGREQMLVLSGQAPASRWSPDARLQISPNARALLNVVHHDDPLFREASEDAIEIAEQISLQGELAEETEMMMANSPMMEAVQGSGEHIEIAEFAASRLRGDTRIASFSINGWDTHARQRNTMRRGAAALTDTILTLQAGLGPVWDKTAVLCLTEFGRTAHENGSSGTDHGTGGAMLFAGGALRGGQVLGQWPGLGEGDLYAGRDLLPTRDVRAYAAWVMHDLMGLQRDVLEQAVFPGLELGSNPGLVL